MVQQKRESIIYLSLVFCAAVVAWFAVFQKTNMVIASTDSYDENFIKINHIVKK